MGPESQIQAVDKADACFLARVAGGGLPGVIGKYGVRRPQRHVWSREYDGERDD